MNGITAYIMVFNEEKRIEATLKSLKDFDEIVILDKSSTDKTVEIAKRYGAKIHTLPYFDGSIEESVKEQMMNIWASFENEWVFEVTCSDVLHPQLYSGMSKMINSGENYEAILIPLYRYSMGFTSKHSYYKDISYQRKLYKRSVFDWNRTELHMDPVKNAKRCGKLQPENKAIAIYHLTHENLEMILERHLRYAKVEAKESRAKYSKEECLKASWSSILRQVKKYFELRTYKLKEKGKAQLCMLLLYRCAKYLYLYFDKEEEKQIRETYEKIRRDLLETQN